MGSELLSIKNHAYLPRRVNKATPAGYADGGHTDRIRCKIPAGTFSGHSRFQVLFSISHPDLKDTANGGKVANSDGSDIIAFSGSFNTTTGSPSPIPFELLSYDPSTGDLTGWLLCTTSPTADTLVDFCVGSGSNNSTSVWGGERFKTDFFIDSGKVVAGPGGRGYGLISGSVSQVAGLNGWSAVQVTKTTPESVVTCAPLDLSGDLAISMWYSADPIPPVSPVDFTPIMRCFNDATPSGIEILVGAGTIRVGVQAKGGSYNAFDFASVAADDGMWHHLGVILNTLGCDLYFDGSYVGSVLGASSVGVTPVRPLVFGPFDGRLSLTRVGSNRDSSWIIDERDNFLNPSSVLTVIGSETMPAVTKAPTIVDAVNVTLKGNVDESLIRSDNNAIFQNESKPMGQWLWQPVLPDHPITVPDWKAGGRETNSKFYDPVPGSQIETNVESYLNPAKARVPMGVKSPCCVSMWSCNGTVGMDACTDPNKVHFIQHLTDHRGPEGFSNPMVHSEADALMTTWIYCGECDSNGLLATIPTDLP